MKPILALALGLSLALAAQAQNAAKKPAPRAAKPAAEEPAAAAAPAPAVTPAPAPVAAEPAVPGEAPEATVARFFASLQKKEVDVAYDQLTRGTKIAERADDVKMLKSKTKDAISVFGAMHGFESVAKKAVGERLISYTYVSLGKEFPLRWRFYFYKPQENWKLIDLRVDDRLSAIFEEPEPAAARAEQ